MYFILKTITEIRIFLHKLRDNAIGAYAAQSAFFIFISFFPFAMLLLNLFRFLPFSADELSEYAIDLFSPTITDFFTSIIDEIKQKSTGTIISIVSVGALWSSSKGVMAVVKGLNSCYEVKEHRGYVHLRLVSLLYTLILVLSLVAMAALLVFGGVINRWVTEQFPELSFISEFITAFKWFFSFVVLTAIFAFLYNVIPVQKSSFVRELPGALFSSLGWLAFSALFAYYVDNIANYSYFYGSLTAVVLLMLWIYFCMYILFLGAEINDVICEEKYLSEAKKWIKVHLFSKFSDNIDKK